MGGSVPGPQRERREASEQPDDQGEPMASDDAGAGGLGRIAYQENDLWRDIPQVGQAAGKEKSPHRGGTQGPGARLLLAQEQNRLCGEVTSGERRLNLRPQDGGFSEQRKLLLRNELNAAAKRSQRSAPDRCETNPGSFFDRRRNEWN